jgi:uncharacterized protein
MTIDTGPVRAADRIVALDVIRGFALLGIFIMNMPGFNTSVFAGADGSHLFNDWWDRGMEQARTLLFDGKFNSMFSFLFGLGFTIQLERLRGSDPVHANAIYLRRLLVLLLLGVVHAWVFWFGDVLHIYAVLGILLIFVFSRLSDRWIIALVVFCLSAMTFYNLWRLPSLTPEFFEGMIAQAKQWEVATNRAFGAGSFSEAVRLNGRLMNFFYSDHQSLVSSVGFYLQMCTTMLLGLLAGRHRWIQDAQKHLTMIRRIQWWALGVGLVAGGVAVVARELSDPKAVSALDFAGGIGYRLSRVALMSFYIATIVRLAQVPDWQRRFAPIALAGRMPLTNYLAQTALGLTIFYGWGIGLWGKFGPLASTLLAVGLVLFVQVPFSRWWLERYRYGPLEYLWRVATYGRLQAGQLTIDR